MEKRNNPCAKTLSVKVPNKHALTQIKDVVRDSLGDVKIAVDGRCVVPGIAAVEVAMAQALAKNKPSPVYKVGANLEFKYLLMHYSLFPRFLLRIPVLIFRRH